MRDLLERLVDEMVTRGVHFTDAVREFEDRFIDRTLTACEGSIGRTAEQLGLHRNTLTRRLATRRRTPAARRPRA